MTIPDELRYTAEHEWVAINGTLASVGITDFAQRALGEVESTKSVSDIYCPVDGEVAEVNADLEDDPALVNSDPYGAGWLMKVTLDPDADPSGLLTADEYADLTKDSE